MSDPTRRALIKGTLAASLLPLGLAPLVMPATAGIAASTKLLARGFNLPEWADNPNATAPAPALLQVLQHLGFTNVRLPLDPLKVINAGPSLSAHLSPIIEQLHSYDFGVTLDLHPDAHHAQMFANDPNAAANDMVAAWKILAPILSNFPTHNSFAELLNEPPMARTPWLALRERLAQTVRQSCPNHTLIWGAARVQGIWETREHPPLSDPNSIAAIHYYTPIGFTHQCADWSGPNLAKTRNLPFPATKSTPAVKALYDTFKQEGDANALAFLNEEFSQDWAAKNIQRDFADIQQWSQQNKCPVILNEFGVLDFCVDQQSRTNWIWAVRKAAEAHGIGWAYWELDHGFGFVKDRTNPDDIDYALVSALMAG